MSESEIKDLKSLTDRELLIKMAVTQEFQTEAIAAIKKQADNIEIKLIDDLDKRIRNLENSKIINDSKDTVKSDYWPNFIKFVTVVAGIVAVLMALKPLIIR